MQLRASAPEGAADAARARLRLAVGLAVLLALLAGATRAWDAAPAGYTEPNPPPRASRRTLLEEEPVADAFPVRARSLSPSRCPARATRAIASSRPDRRP